MLFEQISGFLKFWNCVSTFKILKRDHKFSKMQKNELSWSRRAFWYLGIKIGPLENKFVPSCKKNFRKHFFLLYLVYYAKSITCRLGSGGGGKNILKHLWSVFCRKNNNKNKNNGFLNTCMYVTFLKIEMKIERFVVTKSYHKIRKTNCLEKEQN